MILLKKLFKQETAVLFPSFNRRHIAKMYPTENSSLEPKKVCIFDNKWHNTG